MAEDKKKDEIAVIEINEEFMKQKLYEFRGCKVLLDADLAEVYGYDLKAFNQPFLKIPSGLPSGQNTRPKKLFKNTAPAPYIESSEIASSE